MFVKASTFDLMDKRQQEKFNKIISLIREDTVSPKDIEQFLLLVLNVIKDSKNELNKISSETLTDIAEALDLIKKNHSDTISEIDKKATEVTSQFNNKLIEFNLFVKEVKKMRLKGDAGKDGKDGVNPNPEDVVPLVLEKIPKPIEETGETIADKLELLKGDKRLDASAIKNLPEATGGKGGSTARNLWQLHDVSIDAPANNEVLKYNSTTNVWENGTGGGGTIDGSGTTNELSYWVDSNTIGALAVATYPSLTELSYAKGVTSAIQTQLNGKQASMGVDDNYVTDAEKIVIGNTSGTNTGDNATNTQYSGLAASKANIAGSLTQFVGNTAWRVFYSDSAGDITELALGADGTFLKSNGASSAPTFATPTGSGDVSKVGTPVNNQVGVWTGDGTIEGDASLTWDGTSFNIATAKNFQIAGGTVLADSAGTLTLSGIDAIDATTEATIEGAIDTLANLTSVQGLTVTLADAGADALLGWDDSASAYQNLSATDAKTALSLNNVENTALSTWTGSANIATVGTIGTGVWQGTTIKANYLQQAAADLGDADITVDLSNSNVGNVTNFTIDGALTFASVGGNWTNASRTVADLGTVTTVDINGGTIDGVTIGGASAGAITGTSFTVNTDITIPNTGLHLLDSNASHDLIIKPGSNLTADKTLTLTTGDADVILDLTAVTDEYVLAYDTGTNTWRGVASSGGASFGTDNQIPFTNAGGTDFDYSANLTFNGTALALAGNQTISQGTITTDVKALDVSSTWNNGAVAFTGIKLNATQTASASTSLLMDLQKDSTSVFKVAKNGAVTIDPGSGFGSGSSNPVLTLRSMYGTSSFYGDASSILHLTGSFQIDSTLYLGAGIGFQAVGQTVNFNSGNITNLNNVSFNGSLSFIKMYHDYNGSAPQADQGIIMRYGNRSSGTYPRAAFQVYNYSDSTEIPFMVSSQGFAWLRNSKTDEVAYTIKGATSQTANLQNWIDSSDAVLASVSAAGLGTFAGVALGSNSLTMTGSLAATGARVTKGWFTDIESTNMPTVGGTAILTSLTAPQFTTIELGHASDTTLSRVSAGVVAIEGVNILTTAGGTLTGNITLGENTAIAYDPSLSADGKYCGDTVTGTAGATLAFGDLVYLAAADSRWELVDADAVGTAGTVLIGMCVLAAAADGDATNILLRGFIRADTAFPALTISAPVYAGETAGDVQTTIPTGADAVIRVLGFALTADSMYFNPSQDHQTVVA